MEDKGRKITRWIGIGILAVLGMLLFVSVGGFVVRALWNWLMPELFGLPLISFWQGLGLLVLTRLLFGGMGGPGRRGKHRKHKNRGKHWKLSSEEKEHLEQAAAEEETDESQEG
ncbi:MAG: hypothetical protein KIT46_08115 [Anaerolineales bacterium]|nr:hypothetical protein [Anaerolineales bacterium]MCW5855994.1 hypothetical protein [Anaerolineales bacterium]